MLKKRNGTYRYKSFKFKPGIPIEVSNPDDIANLLEKEYIKKYERSETYLDDIIKEHRKKDCEYNIGVMRLGGIGDVIHLHGMIGSIKRKYPSSYITAYIFKSKPAKQILQCSQYVDEIVEVRKNESISTLDSSFSQKHSLFYSLCYSIRLFVDGKKIIDTRYNGGDVFEKTLELVKVKPYQDCLFFDIPKEHDKFSGLIDRKYIIIHIGAGHMRKLKQWSLDKWEKLTENLDCKIIQVGLDHEPLIKGAVDMRSKLSILEVGWLIKNAHFTICVDSAIMHLSRAMGTRSISLFGPTPIESWGYDENINLRNDDCPACWRKAKEWYKDCQKENVCMRGLKSREVLSEAKKLLLKAKYTIKAKQSFDFVVFIPTKDRPNMLLKLLKQIEKVPYRIKVIVCDDASSRKYTHVKNLIKKNDWVYFKYRKNRGKEKYWQTVNDMWDIGKEYYAPYYVYLCDDYKICKDFFMRIKKTYQKISDPFILNIWTDSRVFNMPNQWGITKFPKMKKVEELPEFIEIGWFDGGQVFPYQAMNDLEWRVNPICFKRWRETTALSSGVWQQISNKIVNSGYRIFAPLNSFIEHTGFCNSKMHKSTRKKEPLKSIRFIDDLTLPHKQKKITIIIPAYKAVKFIDKCLDSIKKQTYFLGFKEYEILVGVDNCQDTLEYLKKIQFKYKNLKVFYFKQHCYPYKVRNSLAWQAKYKHIIFFDADDIMEPCLVEETLSRIKKNKIIRYCRKNINLTDKQISTSSETFGTFGIMTEDFKKMGGFKDWECEADAEFLDRIKKLGMEDVVLKDRIYLKRLLHGDNIILNSKTSLSSEKRKKYREIWQTRKTARRNNPKLAEFERIKITHKAEYKAEVILLLYKRINNLSSILESLEKQTNKNFKLQIVNNNYEDKSKIDEIIKNSSLEINIKHYKRNQGSVIKLQYGKNATGNPLIFLDDDMIPDKDFIEYSINRYKYYGEDSILGWWGYKFTGPDYWNDRIYGAPGDHLDYIGSGSMVCDKKIFQEKDIMDIPGKYKSIEDLWISYIASKHKYKKIKIAQKVNWRKDKKDQHHKLHDLKNEMLDYLRKKGWQICEKD